MLYSHWVRECKSQLTDLIVVLWSAQGSWKSDQSRNEQVGTMGRKENAVIHPANTFGTRVYTGARRRETKPPSLFQPHVSLSLSPFSHL